MASWPDLSGNSPVSNPNFEVEPGLSTYLLFKQGFVTINSTQFSNPKYMDDDLNKSVGFSLGDFSTVVIEWSLVGTGMAVTYEQTFDPTGQAGWFSVSPQVYSANSSTPATSNSVSVNTAYVFPALGCRMRVRVTALSSGSSIMNAALMTGVLPVPQNLLMTAGTCRDVQPTAQSNGTTASTLLNRGTVPIVDTGGLPQLQTTYSASLGTTTETNMIAANATARSKLNSLYIKNNDTISHTYTIREGVAGTVIRTKTLAAGADWEAVLPDCGIWASAQNRAWTWQIDTVQTTNPSLCVATFQTLAVGS